MQEQEEMEQERNSSGRCRTAIIAGVGGDGAGAE
jgi:hypothetical protein